MDNTTDCIDTSKSSKNKFNIIENINSSIMHISNCLEDPEKIVSALKDKEWKGDRSSEGKIGPFTFFREPDLEYKEIFDAMMQVGTIFLSNANKNIADYETRYKFHKVVSWEVSPSTLVQHQDRWVTRGEQVSPEISLSMYLTDDYEGGEVTFSSFEKTIKPTAGDVLVFNSNILHGTEPYLGGRRMTIQCFLFKK
jgi:hypothetical protein